jgi:site-specific recombinase XerD
MSFRLVYHPSSPAGRSPFRIQDNDGKGIDWLNTFLDAQHLRNLSPRSVRAYGFDLLHFLRWWHPRSCRRLSRLDESILLDYVRHQLQAQPQPTPQTINHRLTVLRGLYRFCYGCGVPHSRASVQSTRKTRFPRGYGKVTHQVIGLRVKQPRRVVIPLSAEEVSRFWASFRSYRDLSIVALMLFNGLRSREIIELRLQEFFLSEARFSVRGKGNKERMLPLADDTLQTVQRYLESERPSCSSPFLFLSLKGIRRGRPMTPAGLRSLFRHHRRSTHVPLANPHRFRHTFGSDMVRSGVSLPALMHLMGHARIRTTMLYVRLSPEDVWREYHRAIQNRPRLSALE